MNFTPTIFVPLFIHPLFILVFTLIIGITLQSMCASFFIPCIVLLILGIVFYFIPWKSVEWRIFILCALGGFSLGAFRLHQQVTHHEKLIQLFCNQSISCKGTITDICISQNNQKKHRITLSLSHFKNKNDPNFDWSPIEASVHIYTRKKPICNVEDSIEIDDIIFKQPLSNSDFNQYLIKEGIVATAFVQQFAPICKEQSSWKITSWIHAQKTRLLDALRNRFSQSTFALFTSLFLGNRSEEKAEQEQITQQSKNWGTSHHLARSGLHLVIFIYLLHSLLRFLPISVFAKEILLILLCIIYHLFSWSSVSFLRAFITFLFYKVCALLSFPSHVLHILTLACGLILFFNPMQLFFLDFQLSFGLTFTLAWFNAAYQAMRHQ